MDQVMGGEIWFPTERLGPIRAASTFFLNTATGMDRMIGRIDWPEEELIIQDGSLDPPPSPVFQFYWPWLMA